MEMNRLSRPMILGADRSSSGSRKVAAFPGRSGFCSDKNSSRRFLKIYIPDNVPKTTSNLPKALLRFADGVRNGSVGGTLGLAPEDIVISRPFAEAVFCRAPDDKNSGGLAHSRLPVGGWLTRISKAATP